MRKAFVRRLCGRRDERGTTLIEFALAFPALCAVLFGIIDGGRFIGARVALSQGVAEATRTACLSGTMSQATVDGALASAAATLPGANVYWAHPDTTCTGGCGTWPRAAGDVVFLVAQYNFDAVFFKSWFSKNITQTSRMVCE